jgi:hypothetical protein
LKLWWRFDQVPFIQRGADRPIKIADSAGKVEIYSDKMDEITVPDLQPSYCAITELKRGGSI